MERIRMGPLGENLYKTHDWDETGHNVISHINVSYNINGVTSIQFGYVENGALVMSKTHGSSSDECSRRILRLNHETEFVTGISGEISSWCISSLTFHTNQRTLELFHSLPSRTGNPKKMEFHSGILEDREFGGFFGSCCNYRLKSIGFYASIVLPEVKKI